MTTSIDFQQELNNILHRVRDFNAKASQATEFKGGMNFGSSYGGGCGLKGGLHSSSYGDSYGSKSELHSDRDLYGSNYRQRDESPNDRSYGGCGMKGGSTDKLNLLKSIVREMKGGNSHESTRDQLHRAKDILREARKMPGDPYDNAMKLVKDIHREHDFYDQSRTLIL